MLGRMSGTDVTRLHAKHLNHHLTQFGVYRRLINDVAKRIVLSQLLLSASAVAVSAQAPAPPAGQAGRRGAPASSADGVVHAGISRRRRHSESTHAGATGRTRYLSALNWTNAPAATQSFVVHMRDPEVARNRTTDDQVHWLVWNIPGTEKGLPEGMPEGAQLPNGIRQISASGAVYRGPGAPAAGPMHHYTFEVYALDTKLDVPPGADAWETRRNLFKAMDGHVIGKAVMVGLFKRPQ